MFIRLIGTNLADMLVYYFATLFCIAIVFYTAQASLTPKNRGLNGKVLYVLVHFLASGLLLFYDTFLFDLPPVLKVFVRYAYILICYSALLCVMYKGSISKILSLANISLLVNVVASAFIYYIGFMLSGGKEYISEVISIQLFVTQGLIFITMLVLSGFVIKFARNIPHDVPNKYWQTLAAMEVMMHFVAIVPSDILLIMPFNPVLNLCAVLLILFSITGGILAILMFSQITQFYNMEKQHVLLTTQNAALLAQLSAENTRNENLRSFKHDINGLLTAIFVLAENKKFENIKSIAEGKLKLLKENETKVYTENQLIDGILNIKLADISKAEIPVETELAHLDKALPFASEDICSILLNLIENAVDASLKLKEAGGEPLIYIKICIYKNHLSVIVKNFYCGEIVINGNQPVTTKADKRLHGYGLRNVELYVGKYNGIFRYTFKDGEFTTKVMLPLGEGGQ